MKLVRLYPRNIERGWLIQTYVDPQLGLKFVATRGWYEVDDQVAEELKAVKQKAYDPRSGKAFAVAKDKEEARWIEKNVINPPEKEEELIGTIDAPVPAAKVSNRPGARAGKTRKRGPKKRSLVVVKDE